MRLSLNHNKVLYIHCVETTQRSISSSGNRGSTLSASCDISESAVIDFPVSPFLQVSGCVLP